MAQQPIVLQSYAALPPDDPLFVQREAAIKAKIRAIQLATFVPFDDIPAAGNTAFAALLQAMEDRLKDSIKDVKDDLKRDLAGLKEDIRRANRSSLKAINGTREDGSLVAYEIVPFFDGSLPGQNLPALVNIHIIAGLTTLQAAPYITGHHGQAPDDLPGKRRKVAELVGVSASLLRQRFGPIELEIGP